MRRKGDSDSYLQRFTPRKTPGTRSRRNQARVRSLIQEGRMMPRGVPLSASCVRNRCGRVRGPLETEQKAVEWRCGARSGDSLNATRKPSSSISRRTRASARAGEAVDQGHRHGDRPQRDSAGHRLARVEALPSVICRGRPLLIQGPRTQGSSCARSAGDVA